MSFITLDFETFFRSKANAGTPGPRFSLSALTYEEYIFGDEFDIHGVAIKIDNQPTQWYPKEQVEPVLRSIFVPGNKHILLCHNTMFDGAILSWKFGLTAAQYFCTQSMSQALWNHASASLDALAKRLFKDDKSKRKGDELMSVDGLKELTPEQNETLGGYAINDVDLTFECFREMWKFFPNSEFPVMSMTLRMFIEPAFVADTDRLLRYQAQLAEEKETLLQAVSEKEHIPYTSVNSLLSSNDKFAAYLEHKYQIKIPKKHSPTPKNPNNYTWALAKDDLEFMKLRKDRPDLEHLWAARVRVKSTQEESRVVRLLEHSRLNNGRLAAPLKYGAAHTHRFGGTNKVNFQNFKRGSELRKSLQAPPGFKVGVADLSNIEARMLAWFAEEIDLLDAYRNNRDIYSEFATDIFNRPINRKRVEIDPVTGKEFKPDEMEGNVGKVGILGLGYSMGGPTFQTTLAKGPMGSPPMWFELDWCYNTVKTYRTKYPRIAQSWKRADRVIFDMASKDLVPYQWKCITVEKNRLRLPNGLYLNYPGLRPIEGEESRSFEYWNGHYFKSLYGGLLIENIIQAISRIVMTDMMVKIDAMLAEYGGKVALNVHDEVVFIVPEEHAEVALQRALGIMSTPPDWCNDGTLTLAAEGGLDDCYSK